MADYQRMYIILFNAMTDAIKLLQTAQQTTEDIYIYGDDAVIHTARQEETGGEGESANRRP